MSITRDQFRIQLDRLIDTFGDKPFSEQREHLMWESVDGLAYASVIKIIDGFIAEMQRAPLPKDFREAARDFSGEKEKWVLGECRPREISKCFDCADSGWVRVERQEPHAEWAKWASGSAPCHCDRGRQLIEAAKRMRRPTDLGAQYGPHWADSYKILPWHPREAPTYNGWGGDNEPEDAA